ncbi:MAG: RnfABCDGE type electron transport complex subunit G [Alistipes sp.]|nr:RnfABCDGE type electron transport complex subunit G [Alistipes sp.]
MKSTLLNMVAVLFGITLVASAGVGAVYKITEEPIAAAKAQAVSEALNAVLPSFDASTSVEMEVNGLPVKGYIATSGDEVVGYAVETMTKQGFNGVVKLMAGFLPSGEIYNINVLEQSETPGLGTKMCDEGNPLITSFKGRNPAEMTLAVKKDGGDVDALTAATISSRAYVDAMSRAVTAYQLMSGGAAAAEEACCCEADNEEGCEAQEGGENE